MYRQHFGLRDKPFRVVPSPRFLFPSETHDESRARILYGIRESRGFVVVSGGIGLGKTTVLLSVLDQLESSIRTALVFNPVDTFAQLLRMICFEFGIECEHEDEVQLMQALNLFLVERLAEGEACVLLIDEAQNLSVEVLEKVRTLSNLQTEDASLLQIVLVGQPELMDRLADPRLVQLRQRVGVWHEITPLGIEETRSYVWHRLRLAGAAMPEKLIDDRACAAVYRRTQGIPRLVNQLCDTSLVIAYGRDAKVVGTEHVEEAADELHLGAFGEVTAERPRSSAPKRRWRARRIAGSAAAVLLLAAVALVWQSPWWNEVTEELSGASLFGGTGGAPGLQAPETGSEQLEVAGSAEAAESAEADAAVEQPRGTETLRLVDERRAEVERLRSQGRTLYTAHLASFQSDREARAFVDRLVRTQTDWAEPLYVEGPGGGDRWYRVLAGGFTSRSDAREWIEILRRTDGLGYAQLRRLPAEAAPLIPTGDAGTSGESR